MGDLGRPLETIARVPKPRSFEGAGCRRWVHEAHLVIRLVPKHARGGKEGGGAPAGPHHPSRSTSFCLTPGRTMHVWHLRFLDPAERSLVKGLDEARFFCYTLAV